MPRLDLLQDQESTSMDHGKRNWICAWHCICCFNSCFLKLTWKSLNQPFFSSSKGIYLNNKLPCNIHTLLEVLHTLKSWFDCGQGLSSFVFIPLINFSMVAVCIADLYCFWKLKVSLSMERSHGFPPSSVNLEGPNSLLVLQMRDHKR